MDVTVIEFFTIFPNKNHFPEIFISSIHIVYSVIERRIKYMTQHKELKRKS